MFGWVQLLENLLHAVIGSVSSSDNLPLERHPRQA